MSALATMAERKPRPRATGAAKQVKAQLALALDHVILATAGPAVYAPYCQFQPGWLVGYDGVVAAGYRVAEDMQLAPHTETFRQAVTRAGSPFAVTAMSDGSVVVTGDAMRATVPGIPPAQLPNAQPDRPSLAVPATLCKVICDVAQVTVRSEQVIPSSVQLRANSVVGTNGNTILEGWHGGSLNGQWVLPREFADALARVKLAPTACGFSDTTFTLWFGDDAWLRTTLCEVAYPDTDVYFAQMIADCGNAAEYRPVSTELLRAVETLKPFLNADKQLFLHQYGMLTEAVSDKAASYAFEHHMPHNRVASYTALKLMGTFGLWSAWNKRGVFWYGEALRGVSECSTL